MNAHTSRFPVWLLLLLLPLLSHQPPAENSGSALLEEAERSLRAGNCEQALAALLESDSRDTALARILNRAGKCLLDEGKYLKALTAHQQAFEIYQQAGDSLRFQLANTYISLSDCNMHLGRFRDLINQCGKAMALLEAIGRDNSRIYADALVNTGNALINQGNLEEGLQYLEKALAIYRAEVGPDDPDPAFIYYSIGDAYLDKKAPDKALDFFKESLRLDRLGGDKFYVADDLDNIGVAYQQKKEFQRALEYYEEAFQLYLQEVGREHDYTAHVVRLKGQCYLEMGLPQKALPFLREALGLNLQLLGEQHPDVAQNFTWLGRCMAAQGKYQEALAYFESAGKALNYQPGAELAYEAVLSAGDLLEVFAGMGDTWFHWYETDREPQKLAESAAAFEKAVALVDLIRSGYRHKDAKANLAQKTIPVYESAIRTHWELYRQKRDSASLYTIARYFEKSKATILLDGVKSANAAGFAGIPEALLERENNLAADIVLLETELSEVKQQKAKAATIDSLQHLAFDSRQAYYALIDTFEQQYPDYYRLVHESDVWSVGDIRKDLLRPEEGLLAFFTGDSSVYGLLIGASQLELQFLGQRKRLDSLILNLRDGLLGYHLADPALQNETLYQEKLSRYTEAAHQLYQMLLAPLAKTGLPKKLILAPDGPLGYVPFETLLSKPVGPKDGFRQYPFLLRQHQISYSYSATLLAEMRRRIMPAGPARLLALAPSFSAVANRENSGARDLGPLRYNVPEASAVTKMLGGRLRTGAEATREKFTREAGLYRLLHLSTHGQANDQAGEASFLAFTQSPGDPSEDDSRLYVRDLYSLPLPSELVVLSACETGIGQLQRGEGIVSLARGFSFAGAKSILTTLWQVDDAQSMELVVDFYKLLRKGLPKDEALFQAKQQRLSASTNAKAHPFYWAGFILQGDQTPLSARARGSATLAYGLGAGSLALALLASGWLVWIRRKKRQKKTGEIN